MYSDNPLWGMICFSLVAFKICSCLLEVWLECFQCVTKFILLGSFWASCIFMFLLSPNLGSFFSHSFFECSLPLSLLGLLQCICWSFWWCPIVLLGSVHFSSVFLLGISDVHCLIFMFTDSFFYLLILAFEPLLWIPHFSCSFQLWILFLFISILFTHFLGFFHIFL